MMNRKRIILYLVAVVLISFSCNSNRGSSGGSGKEERPVIKSTGTSEQAADVVSPAGEIYNKYCLTCHQADGSGVPGMYPPLVKAEKITGPADDLVRVILFGLEGPIGTDGLTYAQVMPPQDFISDSDIALLVNYLRKTWGEGGTDITADEVKVIRESGKQ